jgi:4-diphosphocytidyl-2-C-methyl-D-erythritol kinase
MPSLHSMAFIVVAAILAVTSPRCAEGFVAGPLPFFARVTANNKVHGVVVSTQATVSPDAYGPWEVTLRSPCKLNLFLRILGRRPTGYHDLASLFQAISFSDYMYFSKLAPGAGKDELVCSDSSLAVDDSNLVIKALSLMRAKTGVQQYFRVFLDKHVPMQAGLGGGSGNAATAMHAFNALCGYPGSLADLRAWSGDIGSDITFFFSTGTAYCTGRGEIVQPLPALPEWEKTAVHVFKPAEGLSTALVFKALQLDSTSPIVPDSLLDCFETKGALLAAAEGRLVNDLEPPAFTCNPALKSLRDAIAVELGDHAMGVMMSGSGTSIYAIVRGGSGSKEQLEAAVGNVLKAFPTVRHFECNFINKVDDVRTWYQ